jgi:hypothetical protein
MGKYSELIGSFKRMGSFPMEANFIFENETALKDFYSSPEEAATLHKGLLKLVADSATGEQSLWWVTKKQTNDELEFTKLIDSTSVESLEELAEKLEKEIYDRQVADDAIYGSSDHTVVPEDLNSLLKIAEAIAELREAIEEDGGKIDTIKEELKATVGTELDDIREYLKTLDYQSLTAVSKELHRFLATREPDTDSIDTFPELLDFLAGFKDTDVLQDVLDTLVADIMGDPLPTEPFRTLRGIEDFVREFKAQSENTDANLQTELDQTQVGVGLSGDGAYNPDKETYYLKDATSVMNALKILDSLINEAINNCNLEVEDTNTVDLTINKQTTKTVLSADVKISTNDGNGIQAKNDGLFYKLETEYENGILTVKVNDNIISRHTIGLSTIVESAKYDPDQEAIIMVFKLLDGSKQELVISVGTLIREWEVDNSHPTKVVVLEKEDVLGGGTDKLSADVRLYVDKYQILEKRDNTLYVKGTTDNLTHNDEALDVVIDRIISSGSDTNDALQAEIDRAKAAEQALDNKITAETTRADKVETQLRNDLDAEIKRATGVETDLQKQIDNLQDSTSTDISELEAALKAEVERSTEKDAAHDTAISEEVARATEAENQLRRDLTTTNEKVTANTANIEKNADAIAKETERATAAESSLSDGLRAEIERATTKETELEGVITTHINDTNNPHNVTKEQVGLGKVDNTTDLEKPVSVATQAALDTKADKTYVDAQLDTKAPIDSPVFKGNPQVENPPAPNDSSNRIPSTAWVNETIKNSVSDGLEAHIKDFNNPHKVTAEQTGAYTKEQVDGLLDTKADLVDGKIPADQLPDDVKDSVHYDGTWDAATNSPALVPGDKDSTGKYYLVTSNGVFDGIQYNKGDLIINADGQWIKIDNTDLVTSVNGKIGDVVIRIADIENLQNILDSKANSSDVYTKQEIDNKLADLLNQHTQDIENVQQSITNIEGDITNLTNNKADLIDGKIPTNQLPDSIIGGMKYMGTWSAKDNDPQLNNGDPTQDGWYYIVSEAGERFGEVFDVKDWVVNSKGTWGKIDNVDSVVSVNGKKGIVIIEIGDIPGLKDAIDKGGTGLEDHITDYNNPHHVTKEQVGLGKVDNTSDLEKPISIAVQEALNNIKIDATGYATKEELTNHINDKNNPHNVTKEQIGLGNVDNTSDMNKPISTATQMALDKKADVHHSHTMTDITDLENLPIIKGFVTVLSELPESTTGGDKYIMSTQVGSGSTRYTLLEFDGATGTWKQKLLTTGGIAAVIDGDVWELTSKGIKRVLDADDYKYFYDKVWGETKDLVQSIEWDDTVSNKIRLKVTTKKSYADPNTDEATKPTVTPKVTYIDIEKERFMSSAYSRPATQEDVNNGYASKVGVPVLVIELTTGDEIVIDLTDTMNIYDPIDTSSINMEVSNWTGTAATSYKISATLKIAENSDAVKLVDNGTSGVYARLDKKNTNSIQMVDDGSLSANLVIDTAKNNLSDILLTIGAAGLSAQFIVGEYD